MLVAPFTQQQAVAAQRECGQRLGVPVGITNGIGMKLKLIPAGEFMMGSPESEVYRLYDEYQHRVRITKPFYLGVYEVTQAEYEHVMGENPSSFSSGGSRKSKVFKLDTSRFPVEGVIWQNAVEFLRKLSDLPEEKAAGRIYRLPTEAEWEYACRAGTTTRWHCGDNESDLAKAAWFEDNSENQTHPVGQKEPNAWGLYDMHGNVWEWCNDWYAGEYYKSSPENDPLGPTEASYRVFRGGSWDYGAGLCRSAYRFRYDPVLRADDLGFRVAADPPSQSSQDKADEKAEPKA